MKLKKENIPLLMKPTKKVVAHRTISQFLWHKIFINEKPEPPRRNSEQRSSQLSTISQLSNSPGKNTKTKGHQGISNDNP